MQQIITDFKLICKNSVFSYVENNFHEKKDINSKCLRDFHCLSLDCYNEKNAHKLNSILKKVKINANIKTPLLCFDNTASLDEIILRKFNKDIVEI